MLPVSHVLPTLIMIAEGQKPSKGHVPFLSRSKGLKARSILEAQDPSGGHHEDGREVAPRDPEAAGLWISPVHTHGETREALDREIQATNAARNREITLTFLGGKLALREYGKTLAKGGVGDLISYLSEVPKRSLKMARFLGMGEDEGKERPSLLDAHVAEIHLGTLATGMVSHVDGDRDYRVSISHR